MLNNETEKLKRALSDYQQARRNEAERSRLAERERKARIEREQQEMKRFLAEKLMPFAVSVGIIAGWIYLVYLAVCFTTSLGIDDSPWFFMIDFVVRYIGSLSIVAIPFSIFKLSDNNFVTLLIAVLALVLAVMSYAYIP